MGKGQGVGEGGGDGSGDARGRLERITVPAMPMPMAVVCCFLNFLIPGLGTIVAGFAVFCCARNEDLETGSRFGSCCISFGIGLLQLLTVILLFLGWIWSCIWGVFFLGMSAEYYHNNDPNAPPRHAGAVIHPHPQGTPVVIQPGTVYYQAQPVTTYNIQGYVPPPAYSATPQQPPPPAYPNYTA